MTSRWGNFAPRNLAEASPVEATLGVPVIRNDSDDAYGGIIEDDDPNKGRWGEFVSMSSAGRDSDSKAEVESRNWQKEWDTLRSIVDDRFGGNWGAYLDSVSPGAVPVYPEMWMIGGTKAAPAATKALSATSKSLAPAAKVLAPVAGKTLSNVGMGISKAWSLYSGNALKGLGQRIGGKISPRVGNAMGELMAWGYRGLPTLYTGAAIAANTGDKDPYDYAPKWAWDAANKAGLLSVGSLLSYPISYLVGRNENVRGSLEGEIVDRLANYADKKMRGADVPIGPTIGGKSMAQNGWGSVDMLSDAKGTMDELVEFLSGEKDESELGALARSVIDKIPADKMEKIRARMGDYVANRERIRDYGRVGTDIMLGAPVVSRAIEHGVNALDSENPDRESEAVGFAREVNNAVPIGRLMYGDVQRIAKKGK